MKNSKKHIKDISVLVLMFLVVSCSQKPLKFIVHPDYHAGDLELGLVQPSNGTFAIEDSILSDMQQFDAKYILLSGDMLDGLWMTDPSERRTKTILKSQAMLREKFAPGSTDDELVKVLAKICYDGLNNRFRRYGLEPVGAIGDHEVGDQNWPVGSQRADAVPAYKEAFIEAYTLDNNGKPKYDGMIGNVPQRPVGTAYENTAYAFVDQNVLFVTLDLYRFEGLDKTLDKKSGVLSVELAKEQGEWLDKLLTEAAKIKEIEFTIVQAHHPIVLPIRKVQTSCIMINDMENSSLWKLLTKHKVDAYFSGEVHALAPFLDKQSQVVHIVCGSFLGNTAHNYLVCEATPKKLVMKVREKIDDGNNYEYETTGELILDKTTGVKQVNGSGRLKPFDLNNPMIQFNFDEDSLTDRIYDSGEFGSRLYKGLPENVSIGEGKHGNGLVIGEKDSLSCFDTKGKSPTDYNSARTISVWVKTKQTGKGTILSLGNDEFNVGLNNGKLVLSCQKSSVSAGDNKLLNDDTWHHIAISYAGGDATLKDATFYIDGEKVPALLDGDDAKINTSPFKGVLVGIDRVKKHQFEGSIDELNIWVKALSDSEVGTLCK